ncbi:MAG: molybdopterin biosynthesis protein [Anaerolineaceae bacterium]|nr:molybdopterin biosynthesis protein [Anaerolineaceae bacterium]
MTVYLHDIPLPQAKDRLNQALFEAGLGGVLGGETILLDEAACGRVLAEAVWARLSSPHYHASAMDGFALRAASTAEALPSRSVRLLVGEQTVYVDTGDPLPDWANAVVPIENVEPLDEAGQPAADPRKPDSICLREALSPWTHVRPLGEDIVATELVLPAGHALRPVDLGAVAACGHTQVVVARRPRVAVLPSGTELVAVGQEVKRGDIIEYNSLVLAGQVNGWGGVAKRWPITPDNFDLLCRRVQEAADESDLVLLNAGSSAGSEDFSARVVEQLGELLVHGVAVRPGHPVIVGLLNRTDGGKTPIIGVPGYPVSAALTGEIFVEPLLAMWLGRGAFEPQEVEAALTRKVTSPAGDDDYMRVVVGQVGAKRLAAPISRGAGVITSLVRADGIVILPRGVQGLEAGAPVRVRLYRPAAEIERTIMAIGSHDMTLDLVAQFLAERGRRLVSANVGSLGGLVALRRGEAHLAGSHLLDPESGEYNRSYVARYLPETPVTRMSWVERQQGLLVKKGNPKGIADLRDLVRADVTYVNRQRGAGTRVLLDYHLGLLGITPEQVQGYDQEEYTHLAVAAAVASGRADCGMGVAAAARALNLDFIFLYDELYELIIPTEFYESPLLRPLLDLAQDATFRAAVQALPGYGIGNMGQVVS